MLLLLLFLSLLLQSQLLTDGAGVIFADGGHADAQDAALVVVAASAVAAAGTVLEQRCFLVAVTFSDGVR